ncbi:Excinuclease ABC, C subunit N-terminal region [Flavobacterium indicum GPTSA100-9 = DSM 17447]|uniref:Excinuclease ABC, C subunit N-terminal region n=2 Tax=Flavobacterium TaxID=237 RepID=H8XPV1_FLAIG|nr:Excinuclease ABC, C subunit N-terminal region [Flavobacterium indicum GPTSA100-9 = DSM 17447]
MDEFVVYILFSEGYNKTYVGFTSNLIERFKSHNYLSEKGYTIKFRPWKVIHVEFFTTKSEALKREKLFKTGKGRELIKEIISKL